MKTENPAEDYGVEFNKHVLTEGETVRIGSGILMRKMRNVEGVRVCHLRQGRSPSKKVKCLLDHSAP